MDKVPARATVGGVVDILRDLGQPLSENMVRRHIQKAALAQGKDGKYNVAAVLDAIAKHREQDNKNVPTTALKAKKTLVEIQILELKRDEIRRTLIPMEEHLEEVRMLAGLVVRAFDEFTEFTLVETKNPVLVTRLEGIGDRLRSDLAQRAVAP